MIKKRKKHRRLGWPFTRDSTVCVVVNYTHAEENPLSASIPPSPPGYIFRRSLKAGGYE